MDVFERLGLRVGLVVSDEEIREAFRAKAAVLHPDSGGDEKEFAKLQGAQEMLMSPARRLKEWMLVKQMEADPRGQIASGLMDLFQKVSEVGAAAEALIKENTNAQSALAKAMVEVRMMKQRDQISDLLEKVIHEIDQRISSFPKVESGELDPAVIMRDLVFLEKWRATLRGIFSRLI